MQLMQVYSFKSLPNSMYLNNVHFVHGQFLIFSVYCRSWPVLTNQYNNPILSGLDGSGTLADTFYKGDSACEGLQFAVLRTKALFKKASTLKGKNLLSHGTTYFRLEETPFKRERKTFWHSYLTPLKECSPPLKSYLVNFHELQHSRK